LAETCLREVLADFRPNLGALRRHVKRYGPEAAQDFTERPVTAQWRIQHVLVPTVLKLDGPHTRSSRRTFAYTGYSAGGSHFEIVRHFDMAAPFWPLTADSDQVCGYGMTSDVGSSRSANRELQDVAMS
jgi:hypothetical protein